MKTELIIPSLQQIVNFFKEETVDQIAKETGFSQLESFHPSFS